VGRHRANFWRRGTSLGCGLWRLPGAIHSRLAKGNGWRERVAEKLIAGIPAPRFLRGPKKEALFLEASQPGGWTKPGATEARR
jgi:hypothetical protein